MKFFLVLIGSVLTLNLWAAPAQPPNIIIILADDLGYADLSCQGAPKNKTPRIDQMAREGARFTDAYAASPYCSPSRAALLTGRLPARCGLPYVLFPEDHHGLPTAEITLAQKLKGEGYATACIGKWHLGSPAAFKPQRKGFDVFFGLPYSNDSNEWPMGEPFMQVMGLRPLPLMDGDKVVEAPVDQSLLTKRYTEHAVSFIRENRGRPFFLYLPHTMPHIPQYVSSEFAGKSQGGLYGDAVEEIDWSTGVILDTLRELGIEGNTLVVFTSDNGAPYRPPAGANGAKAGKKTADGEGGRFPGRTFVGNNLPLRAGKGTTYEGGVRIPFIARWTGRIPAERVVAEPISLMDLFPTAVSLAGGTLPTDRTYDGRSLVSTLTNREAATAEPRPIYDYFGYQPQAVRVGRWKLFIADAKRPDPRPVSLWWDHQPNIFNVQHRILAQPELYDLSDDVGETRNVASEHPDLVKTLTEQFQTFDAGLQRDLRPMQFETAPPPPAPGTIRKH